MARYLYRYAPIVAALLLSAALAGCLASDAPSEGASIEVDGYSEAREAAGLVLDPETGSGEAEVKLLAPDSEVVDSPGSQAVILLVHDPEGGEPITDADVSLEARMPAMGHGTGPEEDPVHVGDGIYEGKTTWSMAGEWVLHLDVELPTGSTSAYALEIAVGDHEHAPSQQPLDPYEGFGEVMSAPGTVYEGEIAEKARDNVTIRQQASDPAYEHRDTFETKDRPIESLQLHAELEPGSQLDELGVTLLAPDGEQAAAVELTAGEPQADALVDEAEPGEWQINVTGQALGASYDVEVEATYAAPHVDLKTLDPSDPTRALAGERPLLFALFDAVASEPVTDAEVTYTSQSDGEQSPTHEGHGQFQVSTGFEEPGEHAVTIEAEIPTGEVYRFPIEIHAYEPGEVPEGGGSGEEDHDHGHEH